MDSLDSASSNELYFSSLFATIQETPTIIVITVTFMYNIFLHFGKVW